MPPKRALSNTSTNRRDHVAKRARRFLGRFGAGPSGVDDSSLSRMVTATVMAEHAGGGESYLSRRLISMDDEFVDDDNDDVVLDGESQRPLKRRRKIKTLGDTSLQVCAKGLVELLKLPLKSHDSKQSVSTVGWDQHRRDPMSNAEVDDVREYIKSMPESVTNRLFAAVMELSGQAVESSTDGGGISVLALANMFMHERTTRMTLSNVSVPALLLSKVPQCTNLVELDLSSHLSLSDSTLAKTVVSLTQLEKLVIRGCTKLEVLKLANVQNLNDRAITKLVDDSTRAALGWRHIPLSNLRTLKLRSTDVTDASLGRLLGLCAMTLESLDIAYTNVKTLDIVSRALHALPTWQLTKLVVSGLPLTAATLEGFFEPLATQRPENERSKFKKLKIASIPSTSTKQPGLTDAVMTKVMPHLVELTGLEKVSLFQNWELGKRDEPMTSFIAKIGRRCVDLDLTLPLHDWHLEGLFPLEEDPTALAPPRIQRLVLDSSRITDAAAGAIKQCKDLRALHVAETRISRELLSLSLGQRPEYKWWKLVLD
ncbi:hypothetical protein OIO90_001032 [Microbotryomycetes sp. JL221]|nr:hypothetical protein OIO90_001032 [Microbotryomycetes sp. JL221]